MNFEQLDKSLRNILIQYLSDSEILGVIKNGVSNENLEAAIISQTNGLSSESIINDMCVEELIRKVDDILASQKLIESFIHKSESCDELITESTLDKVKKEYEKKLEENSKNYDRNITEYKELIERYLQQNQSLEEDRMNLETEKSELLEKLNQLTDKCEKLESEILQTNEQNVEALSKIEKIQTDYNALQVQYALFERPFEVWSDIQRLNKEIKEYLEELSGSIEVMSILSLGRDERKIEQLWTYLRDLSVKEGHSSDQVSILSRYFEFCIELANADKREDDRLSLFDVEAGSEFNMEECIRSADSRQIGIVSETIVNGVREGDRVRFKAIVNVK